MVRGVDDSSDFGEPGSKEAFDPLSDGDFGEAASLAAALHADPHAAVRDVDETDSSAVGRNRDVHLGVEDLTDALRQITGAARRRSHPGPHKLHVRHLWHSGTKECLDV